MEFLDGKTLADILTKGPLPHGLALGYAIQLADVIKLGPKITDYGLAKLGAAVQGSQDRPA